MSDAFLNFLKGVFIVSIGLLVLVYLGVFGSSGPSKSRNLPGHIVASDTPLRSKGIGVRRIYIHVSDPDITKEQCKALLRHYADRAGRNGQVAIHKPTYKFGQNGALQPWCVDNRDGSDILFNDYLF